MTPLPAAAYSRHFSLILIFIVPSRRPKARPSGLSHLFHWICGSHLHSIALAVNSDDLLSSRWISECS
jgi:hypothetical protein